MCVYVYRHTERRFLLNHRLPLKKKTKTCINNSLTYCSRVIIIN